jgi:hypothetical protein
MSVKKRIRGCWWIIVKRDVFVEEVVWTDRRHCTLDVEMQSEGEGLEVKSS